VLEQTEPERERDPGGRKRDRRIRDAHTVRGRAELWAGLTGHMPENPAQNRGGRNQRLSSIANVRPNRGGLFMPGMPNPPRLRAVEPAKRA
jgi:hypothetical protein